MPTAAATRNAAGSVARNGMPARDIRSTQAYPPTIANAPCARFTKFMRPIVTDRPMLMMNSRLPYATPSNSTPARFPSIQRSLCADPMPCGDRKAAPRSPRPPGGGARGRLGGALVARVLHVLELVELHVPRLAIDHLHFTQIDVLNRLSRRRVDRDRPAGAHPLHSLHRLDELLAGRAGARLLQRLVDEVHSVVAADRMEVRPHPVVRLHEGVDVRLVLG